MAQRAILIVGGDSVIGGKLARALSALGYWVVGTTRRALHDCGSITLDLADPASVDAALPRFDVVYFCAAVTRMAECRRDEGVARQVNATSPAQLALRLAAQGARSIFVSSNSVFDGSRPCMEASAEPRPASVYGRLKAEAEATFLSLGKRASILRLSKVLTPDSPLLRGWATALDRGDSIDAFSDHHFAPIPLELAVQALAALADDRDGGIYQLSATRDISYLEAARVLARRLGRSTELVNARSARSFGIHPSEITNYSSLDSARLADLAGIVPPDPIDVIEQFVVLRSA
jgi:dTDP-4-dehydrorhamnose reductase